MSAAATRRFRESFHSSYTNVSSHWGPFSCKWTTSLFRGNKGRRDTSKWVIHLREHCLTRWCRDISRETRIVNEVPTSETRKASTWIRECVCRLTRRGAFTRYIQDDDECRTRVHYRLIFNFVRIYTNYQRSIVRSVSRSLSMFTFPRGWRSLGSTHSRRCYYLRMIVNTMNSDVSIGKLRSARLLVYLYIILTRENTTVEYYVEYFRL